MKIAIFGQYYQEESGDYVLTLLDALSGKDFDVSVEKKYLSTLKEHYDIPGPYKVFGDFSDLDTSFDLFLSIGGDGTMLKTALFIRDIGIPVLGINTGRLGFLATVQKENIRKVIGEISKNEFAVKSRALLKITTDPAIEEQTEVNFALNEIAVSRKNTTSMITIATWLDDEYLTSYWADGLIVATPTGSTGYSLSCNGPVITPSTDAFVLTPIAPHNLNARPLVIPDKTRIRLKVSGREENFLVSLDSRIATLNNANEILIEKAPFTIKMVDLEDQSFLKTLRNKLLWGEDRRN